MVASVEPADGVFFAIKRRKRQFVVAWNGDALSIFIVGILWRVLEGGDLGWGVGKLNLGDWNGLVWWFGVNDDRRRWLMEWNPAVAGHAEGWISRRWLWRTCVGHPAHGDGRFAGEHRWPPFHGGQTSRELTHLSLQAVDGGREGVQSGGALGGWGSGGGW